MQELDVEILGPKVLH